MIKICMLQAFDLCVSKLLAGAATQAAELPRSGNSTSFQDSFFKTSCRTFPDLVASHQEIRRKEQSRLVRGQRRNRIRQQQRDSTRVSRSPELPSVQIAWKRALETDLSHRSDRFLWGIRHRFAGSVRRWIEVSLLVLVRRCCFRCLFHHGPQHRTQHMLR